MKTVIAFALVTLCIIATQTDIVSAQSPCPVLCQFGSNNRFPHFTRCDRYYECLSGFLFEFTCPQSYGFDIEILQCRLGQARCILDQDVRAIRGPAKV